VEYLRYGTQPGLTHDVLSDCSQRSAQEGMVLFSLAEHSHARIDPGAKQPGPDGALMVGDMAIVLIGALFPQTVTALVLRIIWCQCAHAFRREKMLFNHGQYRARPHIGKSAERKRDGKELIGANLVIRNTVVLNDVKEAAFFRVPET